VSDAALEAEVRRANARLPDYARIAGWIRADAPFHPAERTATANGRVRREAVWVRYGARLASLFPVPSGVQDHAVL